MNRKEKTILTESFLLKYGGYDPEEAKEAAKEAVQEGEPILETLCFHVLVMNVLAPVHTTSWLKARAKNDPEGIISRLLSCGADIKDVAFFARMMQKECLSNFGCIIDGAGLDDAPDLPFQDFRVFTINCETGKPTIAIEEMHESVTWTDIKSEIKQSRDFARRDP